MSNHRNTVSRIDTLLVERGIAPSRARAQALLMAGRIEVDGVRVDKSGTRVSVDAAIRARASGSTYVSRGGTKLSGALAAFAPHGLCVRGAVAADFGASTGGFVDCLLQHGAIRVYAIDVGYGLLHERLRGDPRVVAMERVNARHVTVDMLGESVDIVVIDVSFIGLSKVLGAANRVLRDCGTLVALVKPQFEAGRREVSRGSGVIRDAEVRTRVVGETINAIASSGFEIVADAASVLLGPKGNLEHFVYARKAESQIANLRVVR